MKAQQIFEDEDFETLDIPANVQNYAEHLLNTVIERSLQARRKPNVLASAIIYISILRYSDYLIRVWGRKAGQYTQEALAEYFQCSTAALHNAKDEIQELLGIKYLEKLKEKAAPLKSELTHKKRLIQKLENVIVDARGELQTVEKSLADVNTRVNVIRQELTDALNLLMRANEEVSE